MGAPALGPELTGADVRLLGSGPLTVQRALRLCHDDYHDPAALKVLQSLAVDLVFARVVALPGDLRVLVVTGTTDRRQWRRYNLAWRPTIREGDSRTWHRGFLRHAEAAYAFAKDKGVDAVTGHSLGAAAAQIVGPSLGVPVVALASPRPLACDAQPDGHERVLNVIRRDDLITRLPPSVPGLCRFRRVGRTVAFTPLARRRGEDHRATSLTDALSGAEPGSWAYEQE